MPYHRWFEATAGRAASPLAGDNALQESGASRLVRPDRAPATRVARINDRTDSSWQDVGEASMTATGRKRTPGRLLQAVHPRPGSRYTSAC